MRGIISADEIVARHDTDGPLLADVMQVYKPNCRYLKSAETLLVDGNPAVRAEFSIPEPCYIEDTGHFNAAEFFICFNQMMYYAFAKAVKEDMLATAAGWQLGDFWKRQLDFVIASVNSRFRREVSARHFFGEGRFVKIIQRVGGPRPLLIMDTTCRFWDDSGGRCDGEIKAALVGPPAVEPGGDGS